MFSHMMVGAKDVAASKKFYDAVFAVLGMPAGVVCNHDSGRSEPTTSSGSMICSTRCGV